MTDTIKKLNISNTCQINHEELFPEYFTGNGVKVLIMNATTVWHSWYKLVCLGLEFANNKEVSTCITNIDNKTEDWYIGKDNCEISEDLILRADFIFLPFVSDRLVNLIDVIKEINPKCKVFYNVDFDFESLNISGVENIYENILVSDFVICPNMELINKIQHVIIDKYLPYTQALENIGKLPTNYLKIEPFVWESDLSEVDFNHERFKRKKGVINRIGVFCSDMNKSVLLDNMSFIKELSKKDGVELVVIGKDLPETKTKKTPNGLFKFSYKSEDLQYVKPLDDNYKYRLKNLYNYNLDKVIVFDDNFSINNRIFNIFVSQDCNSLSIPVCLPSDFQIDSRFETLGRVNEQIIELLKMIKDDVTNGN